MSIPLKHSQVFVTCDCSNLHHVQTLLKEPAGGFVSEIMKIQVLYVRSLTGSLQSPLKATAETGNTLPLMSLGILLSISNALLLRGTVFAIRSWCFQDEWSFYLNPHPTIKC